MKTIVKQTVFFALVVILLVGLICGSKISFASGKSFGISEGFDSNYSSSISDEDQIKNTIDYYFNLRYKSLQLLSLPDYSSIVANSLDTKWLRTERDHAEVEQLLAKKYKKIYIDGINALVDLAENNEVIYETSAPDVSKMANLEHTITLIKQNGEWLIVSDIYEDEIMRSFNLETKEQIIDRIQNYKDNGTMIPNTSPTFSNNDDNIFAPDYVPCDYTRSDVAWYASQYYQNYNSYYVDHTNVDCTNFVSQAIVAGTDGIMSSGRNYNTDWYYTTDGSLPWINVPNLYSFLTTNSGTGPYGSGTTNQCYVQQADVIQGKRNGAWAHAVIIDALSSGFCTDLSKIYYSGHDADRYHEPATRLLTEFSELRYIRITGCRQ